jgi:hypothetical protein
VHPVFASSFDSAFRFLTSDIPLTLYPSPPEGEREERHENLENNRCRIPQKQFATEIRILENNLAGDAAQEI